ncbi:MAG: hypothetical protein NTZ65_03045 [Candidatus Berkelbacteria bacterium]|nr:hypothetical protein [Candidatus Berkelbacteria bacterium]
MPNHRQINLFKILKISILVLCAFFVFNTQFSLSNPKTQNQSTVTLNVSITTAQAAYSKGSESFVTKMLLFQHPSSKWVRDIYNLARGFLNILLLVGLLYIAFRNILHLDIENYAIKKLIPRVLAAAVFGNIAIYLIAFLSSMVDKLSAISIFSPRPIDLSMMMGGPAALTGILGLVAAGVIAYFAASAFTLGATLILSVPLACCSLIILVAPWVLALGISLLMDVRPWVVLIGSAVAPIAIACTILPQTEGLFKRWLKIVAFWVFYPLILYAIVYIATKIPSFSGATGAGGLSRMIGFVLPIAIRFGLLLMAFRLPFLWEKDIGGLIAKLPGQVYGAGKKVVGASIGAAATGGRMAYFYQGRARDRSIREAKAEAARTMEGNRHVEWDRFANRRYGMTGADLDAYLATDPGRATRVHGEFEQEFRSSVAEASSQAGNQAFEDFRTSRLNKIYEGVQRFNPGGISSAIKEKWEFLQKDTEKAHYRKSVINEIILGKTYNEKHQEAIQKDDQSNIHSLPELEANEAIHYKKLLRTVAEARGISEDTANTLIQADLQRLYSSQGSSGEYVSAFEDALNFKHRNSDENLAQVDLANVVQGFTRRRVLALQYARSRNPDDVENMRKRAIGESYERMRGMPSGSPTPQGPQMAQISAGEQKIINLLTRIDQGVKADSSASAYDIARLHVQSLDVKDITNDDFIKLTAQSHGTLGDITKHLQGKGEDPEQAQSFIKDLIESNGGPVSQFMGKIGDDDRLQNLVKQYQTSRGGQLALLGKVQGADTVEKVSSIILKQQPDQETLMKLQQSCAAFAKTQTTPQEMQNAKTFLGSQLGLGSGETIDAQTAQNVARALETMAFKEPKDYK